MDQDGEFPVISSCRMLGYCKFCIVLYLSSWSSTRQSLQLFCWCWISILFNHPSHDKFPENARSNPTFQLLLEAPGLMPFTVHSSKSAWAFRNQFGARKRWSFKDINPIKSIYLGRTLSLSLYIYSYIYIVMYIYIINIHNILIIYNVLQ